MQTLATGLDEEHKKPKGMTDQVIRSLDEDGVGQPDRLRLIMLFLLFRDGLLPADLDKLLAHARLPGLDGQAIRNLHLLGARIARPLKDTKSQFQPLFPRKPPTVDPQQEYSLSRFEPALKYLLEEHTKNTLDQELFPFTKPQLTAEGQDENVTHTSLRSAKPTWAKSRSNVNEPRPRILVLMAGGATFSESRACYETMQSSNKDVYLMTSHMLTPSLFMRQAGDLSVDRRRLGLPVEQPKPKAPAHLFEPESPPPAPKPTTPQPQPQQQPMPPTAQIANMNMNGPSSQQNGPSGMRPGLQPPHQPTSAPSLQANKPEKDKKKKHGLFHRSKK